jgi:tRNA threonylcarbamoyladenosine biosynthesis protein TsaE
MLLPRLFELPDESETEVLGRKLALAVKRIEQDIKSSGLHIRLDGDLGAGKTYLARSFLRALGFEGRVKSPTFSLLETYGFSDFTVNHFDFYRMESPEEFEDAGFREEFGPGFICMTEWTAKAVPFVPEADCMIRLEQWNDGRRALIEPLSAKGRLLAEAL